MRNNSDRPIIGGYLPQFTYLNIEAHLPPTLGARLVKYSQ